MAKPVAADALKDGMPPSLASSIEAMESDPSFFQSPPSLREKGSDSDRSHGDLRERVRSSPMQSPSRATGGE